ncbi:cyclic AMP response element-binding protein B isoform X2 [Topomyia yanbarensis]|uniref:cyclic AMP response element-binding protein B isoform X2 n=1 Tax=Topomyia yanbarensis TaxID=2498891 RepID=UPI00273B0782|nr:cyclic AMP response element-binding protein B isoform X2 [Topomyia yanbarensis]
MDNMVEENGSSSLDPLANTEQHNSSSSSGGGPGPANSAASSESINSPANVQILPASQTTGGGVQAHSVIQQNQQSVIQTAAGQIPTLPRGVLLVCNKPNSVIHTTQGSLQAIQIKPEPNVGSGGSIMTDTNSDDTLSDDETPKKRRDLLTRRPSYRKILSDLGGAEIANAQCPDGPGLHAIAATGGGVVQYTQAQDGQIYVPLMGGNVQLEDQSRKREMRLQKNREAARECRRKKKEYIKCLENRVAVLENQNKALIEELKSLKELYCQQKND